MRPARQEVHLAAAAGGDRALQNGDDIDYEGASGPIDMDRAGDATAGVYDLFRFRDGKIWLFDEVQVPRRRSSAL